MRTEPLTHEQERARDESFRSELRALPRFMGGFSTEALRHQVEVGRLMRQTIVRHFPHMRGSFNSLPELEKV